MKFYIGISLLPNPEVPIYFLWEKIYQQIHLALVENQNSDKTVAIGMSFPEYNGENHQLGNKLRIFSNNEEKLEKLNISKWFSRLLDYVDITEIKSVPDNITGYAFFKRLQPKNNNLRLARRKAKRKNISLEEAISVLKIREEKLSEAPYINMKSLSSDNMYRLMIGYEETELINNDEGFSTYGLSSKSSVPIF
jgi:CRISPR-associated endonuclease Csy4